MKTSTCNQCKGTGTVRKFPAGFDVRLLREDEDPFLVACTMCNGTGVSGNIPQNAPAITNFGTNLVHGLQLFSRLWIVR